MHFLWCLQARSIDLPVCRISTLVNFAHDLRIVMNLQAKLEGNPTNEETVNESYIL